MTAEQLVQILPVVIVVLLGGYFLYQLSKTRQLEPSDILTAIERAKPLAEKIGPVARMAVMAAEEYGRTGKLVTSREKLEYAVSVFKDLTPPSWGVTEKQMLDAIHSYIPLANSMGVKIEVINEPKTIPPL